MRSVERSLSLAAAGGNRRRPRVAVPVTRVTRRLDRAFKRETYKIVLFQYPFEVFIKFEWDPPVYEYPCARRTFNSTTPGSNIRAGRALRGKSKLHRGPCRLSGEDKAGAMKAKGQWGTSLRRLLQIIGPRGEARPKTTLKSALHQSAGAPGTASWDGPAAYAA